MLSWFPTASFAVGIFSIAVSRDNQFQKERPSPFSWSEVFFHPFFCVRTYSTRLFPDRSPPIQWVSKAFIGASQFCDGQWVKAGLLQLPTKNPDGSPPLYAAREESKTNLP